MDLPKPKCSSQIFLAVLIIVGFFGALWWVLSHDIPDKNHDAVVYLLGVLNGAILAVIGFFFGSSVGSAAKDKVIGDMAGNSTPPPVSAQTVTSTVQTETIKSAPQPPAAGAQNG